METTGAPGPPRPVAAGLGPEHYGGGLCTQTQTTTPAPRPGAWRPSPVLTPPRAPHPTPTPAFCSHCSHPGLSWAPQPRGAWGSSAYLALGSSLRPCPQPLPTVPTRTQPTSVGTCCSASGDTQPGRGPGPCRWRWPPPLQTRWQTCGRSRAQLPGSPWADPGEGVRGANGRLFQGAAGPSAHCPGALAAGGPGRWPQHDPSPALPQGLSQVCGGRGGVGAPGQRERKQETPSGRWTLTQGPLA